MSLPYKGSRNGEGRAQTLLLSLTSSSSRPIGFGRGPMHLLTPVSWKRRLSSTTILVASFICWAVRLTCIPWRQPSGCPSSSLGRASLTTSQNGSLGRALTLILFTPQLGQASPSSFLLQSSRFWAYTLSRTCSMQRSYFCRPAFARLSISTSIQYIASYIFFFREKI